MVSDSAGGPDVRRLGFLPPARDLKRWIGTLAAERNIIGLEAPVAARQLQTGAGRHCDVAWLGRIEHGTLRRVVWDI
jgi:hypothetical protein